MGVNNEVAYLGLGLVKPGAWHCDYGIRSTPLFV
jgi:hypothetical protein